MTSPQNKRLHSLLTTHNLMPQKANLVLGFTDGKSESSRDLSYTQADQLIAYLEGLGTQPGEAVAADTMRKKIIHMARNMGWETNIDTGRKADMERINNWCVKYGHLKKGLNQHTYEELPALVTQFEAVYQSYLKGI